MVWNGVGMLWSGVGWHGTIYAVILDIMKERVSMPYRLTKRPARTPQIQSTASQLRALCNDGQHYGTLRVAVPLGTTGKV